MKKYRFNKIVLTSVITVFALGVGIAFATPPASFYKPGETSDPSCSPGDTNCDVALEATEWAESGGILAPKTATDDVAVNTDNLYVDVSSGNVGIGTTSPNAKLDVRASGTQWQGYFSQSGSSRGGVRLGSLAYLQSISDPDNNYDRVLLGSGVYYDDVNNVYDVSPNASHDRAGVEFINGGHISFFTDNIDRSASTTLAPNEWKALERVRITNTGNVGIGTTSPTARLDIDGDTLRLRTAKTPSNASDTCNQGDMAWDSDFIYVCVAENTWKRSALSSW